MRKCEEPVDGKFEDATDYILQRWKEPKTVKIDSNSDIDIDNA